jgi:hypothetical protein
MNNYQTVGNGEKRRIKFRYILVLMLITFVGGGILAVWAADRLDIFGTKSKAANSEYAPAPVEARPAFDVLSAGPASMTGTVEPVADRVEDLEARLSRINADAAVASGNAARAEGMLIAFAARRAIDNGADLGYIGNQLTDRFGAAQPQAVAQILSAGNSPVTLDQLRSELVARGNEWRTPSGMTAWAKFRGELSELFILRHENTPSPAPSRRLDRAKQYAEVGNVAAALAEVKNLPGKSQAVTWIEKAGSYVAARAALDKIERAALAQPIRISPSAGTPQSTGITGPSLTPPLSVPSPALPNTSDLPGTSDLPPAGSHKSP